MKNRWPVLLELLETAGPRLHTFLTRLTLSEHAAEDLLQDLFIRLGKSDGFFAASDRNAFAFRVAINLAFDWRRTRQRRGATLALDPESPARESSPLASIIQREDLEQVLEAAGELTEQSRDVFVLHYIHGDSYESVAAVLGKTPQQARGLAHRAVVGIRERLEKTQTTSNTAEACDAENR